MEYDQDLRDVNDARSAAYLLCFLVKAQESNMLPNPNEQQLFGDLRRDILTSWIGVAEITEPSDKLGPPVDTLLPKDIGFGQALDMYQRLRHLHPDSTDPKAHVAWAQDMLEQIDAISSTPWSNIDVERKHSIAVGLRPFLRQMLAKGSF